MTTHINANRHHRIVNTVLLFLSLMLSVVVAKAEEQDPTVKAIQALDWHNGPGVETIAAKATLKTTDAVSFLDESNSSKFLKLTGNVPDPGNFIILSHDGWWGSFNYLDSGYIKDDEKIDQDALLKDLKSTDEQGNEQRKDLGLTPLYTEGWYVPPHYDATTNQLEWGLKVRDGQTNEIFVNYTVRLLGRQGVMNATLVSDPKSLDEDVKGFKAALNGFEFNPGERYTEYKKGDRVAEFGLAALVTGGAVAVAAKKGLFATIAIFFAKMWKLIAIAFVAVASRFKSLFKKKNDTPS